MDHVSRTSVHVYIALALLSLLSTLTFGQEETSWKKQYLYFKRIELSCSSQDPALVTQSVQFWILPSGQTRRPFDNILDTHVTLQNNGFVLTIDRLDDPDFGIYYCIVSTGKNTTEAIKIGINVEGPYYGEELIERYKKNAIIGGIAAGVALVILVIIWVLYRNITCADRYTEFSDVESSTSTKEAKSAIGSAQQGVLTVQEQNKIDGWILTAKTDDSIYDSADALKHNKKPEPTNPVSLSNNVHGDRLLSSDSGHYQTIGSLERDQRLLSESEITDDVSVLKHVIRRDWSETTVPEDTSSLVIHSNGADPDLNLSDSVIYDHADSMIIGTSFDSDQHAPGSAALEEVEYSVSSKVKRQNREAVIVIDGDVVIEPNGTSVTVTTSTNINQTETLPKDALVAKPSQALPDSTTPNKIDVEVAPLTTLTATSEDGEVSDNKTVIKQDNQKTSAETKVAEIDNNGTIESHETDDDDGKSASTNPRKVSSTSTSKSDGESNPSTSVDEDTFSKYQSVLASLLSKQGNGETVAQAKRGPGSKSSRSTSVDSNVFQEEETRNSTETRDVQDVRL